MGTNCAPLVADLFLFCYEKDFMTSLSGVKQAEIIEAFKSTSRYLDDLLNIDNPYFEGMVNRIYPPELQLNKASTVATPIFLSKTVFSYGFRIVFESYRFMPFYAVSNAVWRKQRRFPFSQSQGIDKNAVYRFKLSSLSLILLTNQQPFQAKRF